MKKLHGLVIFLLYFYKSVSSNSSKTIIAEVKKTICLPCGLTSRVDFEWRKNGALVLQYKKSQKFQSTTLNGIKRFSVPNQSTGDMEVKSVELSDSGNYTCRKDNNIIYTVTLFVFEVSATPSTKLISTEDLTLNIKLSPEGIPGLQVYWKKGDQHIENGMSVEIKNLDLERSGQYWCHIKVEGAEEVKTLTEIKVFGFYSATSGFVYLTDPKAVLLPWNVNFKLQSAYIPNEVKIVGVSITYPSQVIKQYTVTDENACWPKDCVTNGNIHLSNPKIGDYQIGVLLEVEGRRKSLWRNVCLANLTVSFFDNDLSIESSVTLQCQTNCLDEHGKLCWQNLNLKYEKCGLLGQLYLAEDVIILPKTLGNWTCHVVVGQKMMASANLTLEVQADFVNVSNYLFWVAIGVGILILFLFVMVVVIVVARSRRLRRSRKRAWVIQNIHQQKRCECKGSHLLSPQPSDNTGRKEMPAFTDGTFSDFQHLFKTNISQGMQEEMGLSAKISRFPARRLKENA